MHRRSILALLASILVPAAASAQSYPSQPTSSPNSSANRSSSRIGGVRAALSAPASLLKANPGKYNYASTSPGTAQHLGGELVKKMAGVDMVHIAYKGTGAVMPDLLSGRVPMMFENLAVMTPHIRKGSLRPLAVSSSKRTPLMPEVPTVSETGMGLEGFEALGWFALLAPAKTPQEIVRIIRDAAIKIN